MKVAIGQFGAPTTVLNSSLYGVLEGLQGKADVYGVIGGMSGLVAGTLRPLQGVIPWLLETPGAALLAGRYTDHEEGVERAVQNLLRAQVDAFVLLGGNGTMSLGAAIESKARSMSYPLCVIGVPKTIDNDIAGIDHSPGFPSAARFVLQAVRDLQIDLEAMTGFEQVRIVEVMGRRAGWLAAASALLPYLGWGGPNKSRLIPSGVPAPIICIPEKPFNSAKLMNQIASRVKSCGTALVVVSEGVLARDGLPVLQSGQFSRSSVSGMLGGIGAVLAEQVRQEMGVGVRYENLGLLQRCWNDCSLESDKKHARLLGNLGAQAILDGKGGLMVGLKTGPAKEQPLSQTEVPLSDLVGRERRMANDELDMGEDFVRWLGPLVEIDTIAEHQRFESAQQIRRR